MAQEHSNAWFKLHAHLAEGLCCLATLRHGFLEASIFGELSPMYSPWIAVGRWGSVVQSKLRYIPLTAGAAER